MQDTPAPFGGRQVSKPVAVYSPLSRLTQGALKGSPLSRLAAVKKKQPEQAPVVQQPPGIHSSPETMMGLDTTTGEDAGGDSANG